MLQFLCTLVAIALVPVAAAAQDAAMRQAHGPEGESSLQQDDTPPQRPWARGHDFATLDAYLAYLEQYNGPIDLPWWREVSPGVYEKMVRMPEGKREIATRAELERRWGFTPAR